MIHDQIALLLKDLAKQKEKLREINKDIKSEEKIEVESYLELKTALKQLKKQIKDFEEEYLSQLKSEEFYNKLREMKISTEEDIAKLNERLFKKISELPQKPFTMDVEIGDLVAKIQILPDMKLFINGKEEKNRKF